MARVLKVVNVVSGGIKLDDRHDQGLIIMVG